MHLLLDTHVLLWTIFDEDKLSTNAKEAISDSNNVVSISIASLWEITIKQSIGKISLPSSFFDIDYKTTGFEILTIYPFHLSAYLVIPLHHRDPFERLLIAQCTSEDLILVSCDDQIKSYNINTLW